jgi:hypothetical protein
MYQRCLLSGAKPRSYFDNIIFCKEYDLNISILVQYLVNELYHSGMYFLVEVQDDIFRGRSDVYACSVSGCGNCSGPSPNCCGNCSGPSLNGLSDPFQMVMTCE